MPNSASCAPNAAISWRLARRRSLPANAVARIGQRIAEFAAVLAAGLLQRSVAAVAALGAVVVDQPVADWRAPQRGKKRAAALLIVQNRLIEGQQGDAQLILVPGLDGRRG